MDIALLFLLEDNFFFKPEFEMCKKYCFQIKCRAKICKLERVHITIIGFDPPTDLSDFHLLTYVVWIFKIMLCLFVFFSSYFVLTFTKNISLMVNVLYKKTSLWLERKSLLWTNSLSLWRTAYTFQIWSETKEIPQTIHFLVWRYIQGRLNHSICIHACESMWWAVCVC